MNNTTENNTSKTDIIEANKKHGKTFTMENILCFFIIVCPILDVASFLFRNYFNTFFSISTILRPIIPIIAITKSAIINASKKTYLVMENTKFNIDGNYKFSDIEAINGIITDALPSIDIVDILNENNICIK